MGPGEAVILTGAEPASFGGPAQNSVHLLRVPVRLLSPLAANLEAAYGRTIPADNRALQLLVAYLGILEEMDDAASSHDFEPQVVTHIHDLMALAIGETRDTAEIAKSRGARAARLRAIKHDIANCIGQPDLSVATIAARQRVKARWVQRLFESEDTTFTEYVLAQRLVRAHRHADESPLCRPKDQLYRSRYWVRGSVLFQPRVSPTLWRGTLGIACRSKVWRLVQSGVVSNWNRLSARWTRHSTPPWEGRCRSSGCA